LHLKFNFNNHRKPILVTDVTFLQQRFSKLF